MQLENIDLAKLSVSPANMRNAKKPPDISDILPSVRVRGVLVPLLVRPNGSADTFEIVAGRRRYHAATTVAEEGGSDGPLPCAILEEGDDAAALEASLIENLVRENPDEVTQWEQFTQLVKKGRKASEIADTFGMDEKMVGRILALGNLMPPIRNAYRREEIDAATVRHLTLASKAQQKAWLALFRDEEAYAPRGAQLKAWLFGGASISTSAAIFDLAEFTGQIVSDLFAEDGYFADADQFWEAQTGAIEAKKAQYLEAGWSDVQIIPQDSYFQTWDHEKTTKRKGGRVYIDVSAKGEVTFHEGYLTAKEARVRETGQTDSKAEKPKRPEITGPMAEYIDLHRHAAVRCELAASPYVALRVMVAHAICGSSLWNVKVQEQRSRKEAITESIETSVAEARFDERRRAVLAVLGFDADEATVTLGHETRDGISGLLLRLLDVPDAVVMEILGVVMAETLAAGSDLIETLGVHLDVEMADYWTADEAFFDLVRDREVLTALLGEVGGASIAAANVSEKTKTVKGIIGDHLAGENDREKKEAWVPRWMAFPPSAYTTRGGVGTVVAAERAKWLMEEDEPSEPEPQVEAVTASAKDEDDSGEATHSEAAEDGRIAA
ncbi:ParB/RepB/Spo0J family partition protein [Sphingorhabdus sp. YGSMI21]|uniref:ParB/RepB/Spo0J family partition protein n=1 Tax=Sphingorhabdus sp. YGSMI21 TaxID=2077182 RepID=UPI000C1F6502|nr:ParB/RepB/Spo0J family partition protein [Sphingorhabdus sp. YGSMI21]ATW02106.1 chromosome partitioning protein ParB [Sphingorhabdus sp. YGSMI21]